MRPSRLLAVARRDLALETRGRRGFVLPVITLGLILPASTIDLGTITEAPPSFVGVTGDVPPEVLALPDVRVVDPPFASMKFQRAGERLVVHGREIPAAVRAALEPDAAIRFEDVRTPFRYPGRSLLLALIAASLLTGPVAESLPGERSRHTLEILLAAAITRGELVVGKWLAWAGYGAAAAVLGAAAALLTGRQEAGPWLLAMPFVPACTIALGLYLLRRSSDVVGGSTVSVRVLPALLSLLGIASWMLGNVDPRLGAALPLGGALLASGAAWEGVAPTLIAIASTGLTTAALLWVTARDLGDERATARLVPDGVKQALAATALTAPAWWIPIAGPVLWAAGGNPYLAGEIPREPGVTAGSALLLVAATALAARASSVPDALGLRRPTLEALGIGVAAGLLLALTGAIEPWPSLAQSPFLDDARQRLDGAALPLWAGPGAVLLSAVAQELLFRGAMQRSAGPWVATIASVVVLYPLDPLRGLLVGGVLAAAVHRSGNSATALLAHLVWALVLWVQRGV
jgi:ABC-type Na+ efflux pump permease subunit